MLQSWLFNDVFGSNNCSSIYMINISLNYMTMFWAACTHHHAQRNTERSWGMGWEFHHLVFCCGGASLLSPLIFCPVLLCQELLISPDWTAWAPSEALLDGTSLSLKYPLYDKSGNDSDHNRNINCLAKV